jgi:hypothetical protein
MLTKTSVTALLAAGILGGAATTSSACEWQKQVMAKASQPATEEQAEVRATPIDPALLAKLESAGSEPPAPK